MNERAGSHTPPTTGSVESRQECVQTSLDPDGIFLIDYNHCSTLTLDQAHAAHAEHRRLCPGRRTPVLLTAGRVGRVDYRVQRFASEPSVCAITSAMAIVVHSFLERHLSKLFLMYHRPPYPVQIFSDVASARDWLLKSHPAASHESK
jgi:hypothetical protein